MATTIQQIELPKKARALDTSGNNNHGQIYSGRGLEFDGVGDYLQVPTSAETDFAEGVPYTWSTWVNFASFDNWFLGLNQTHPNVIAISSGLLAFREAGANAAYYYLSSSTLNLNTWYRLVVTADASNNMRLYINGVLDHTISEGDSPYSGSGTFGVGGSNLGTDFQILRIGSGYSNNAYPMEGKMSNFQVWDTAWSAADVTYDYLNPESLALNNGGTALTESNLKLWYPMQDGHRGQQSYILDGANSGLSDIYASNFSSGVDGWTAFGLGGVAGGISIGGEDNSLRYTVTTPIGDTRAFKKTSTLTVGLQYKVTFSYYIPSTNPNLNAVFLQGSNVRNSVLDTWTTVTEYFTASSVDTQIIVGDADMYLNPAATGETAYIKDVLIKEVTRDNVPRIDYTGGGCPHILSEPMRTNLIPYSEAITQANGYSPYDVTLASNQGTTPMGTNNATKLTSTGADPYIQYAVPNTNATFTLSVYAKGVGSSVGKDINFYLIRDSYADAVQSSKFTLTNEWVRYTATLSLPTNPTTHVIYRIDAPSVGVAGDEVLIWGAQLEQGSYATSYIPTEGTTATRAIETYESAEDISSLINDSEGVLFVEMAFSDNGRLAILNSDASDDQVVLGFSGTVFCRIRENGANVVTQFVSSANQLNTYYKIAVKYKSGSSAIWVDGNETVVAGTFTLNDLSKILFISEGSRTYGKVKQLQVYGTALTDEELTLLTIPPNSTYSTYAEMANALNYTLQ